MHHLKIINKKTPIKLFFLMLNEIYELYKKFYIREDIISEEIEPHLKYKIAFVFAAVLILVIPSASASSVGAYNVQVTHDYVKATALCSCGLNGYHYMTGCFENYCPQCHSYGTLKFNPKGTPEGEWTCTQCGSDYCAADGKEKMLGSDIFLKQYSPKTIQPVSSEVQTQEVTTTNSAPDLMNVIKYYNHKSFL